MSFLFLLGLQRLRVLHLRMNPSGETFLVLEIQWPMSSQMKNRPSARQRKCRAQASRPAKFLRLSLQMDLPSTRQRKRQHSFQQQTYQWPSIRPVKCRQQKEWPSARQWKERHAILTVEQQKHCLEHQLL
uniref:(northern house mosquito) hypothetical protein n=1 Tax=Culex pipiens TaxID=7175 RepID=A0A8D8NK84_CULPI